ncbi:EamA family transporter [Rhodospirillum rubrum]|uniref:DMT family transporter n=1 Tax=Rhodospirillum rubrum TaxID=1085 RepID=UPI0019081114|nr:DMT family transporter [Rhodospirillum rubrum]MBK1663121.1 EamA family transporter [Rhodospirillum rubrum]MBK1675732.1 EamA family transporter [Rhodospirillum rubrum]
MTSFMYVFCLLVWGLNFIAVKIQGTPVSLEESLSYRLAGACLLFLALAAKRGTSLRGAPRDLLFMSLFGLCNFAISYLLLYYATLWSTAALVTLVFSMKTGMTPIALSIFLKDRLEPRILTGGAIGLLGVGTLLYPSLDLGGPQLGGVALAFAGTAIAAFGDATSARNARRGIDAIHANCVGFLVATTFITLVCLFQGRPFELSSSPSYLGALLYLVVVASFFAWLFYLRLVERIGAARSGFMVALFPAVGGIASVLLGESEPDLFLILGCLLSSLGAAVALGIVPTLASFPRSRQPARLID